MTEQEATPVLEIGGTHVTAALVRTADSTILDGSLTRLPLSGHGSAAELIEDFVRAANTLTEQSPVPSEWAVAIPGPFDYVRGIGLYENVGKFDSLRGVNLLQALTAGIRPVPSGIHFLNDADAFGIGEYAVGAARSHQRAVCITLGTGVGSSFLERGEPVKGGPLVPPDGSLHRLNHRGRPLEETVSRRAIRAAYAHALRDATDTDGPDVHVIAERSRGGDETAARVLRSAFADLGSVLGPAIERFGGTILVVGGSMARSWDIVEPALRQGLIESAPSLGTLPVRQAERPADAAFSGAGYWVARHMR